jgi:hypothetical protein
LNCNHSCREKEGKREGERMREKEGKIRRGRRRKERISPR